MPSRVARRVDTVAAEAAVSEFVDIFPTALGWMGVCWHGERLARVTFGHPTALAAASVLATTGSARARPPKQARSLRQRLVAFARGQQVAFDDVPLAQEHLTAFQAQVVAQCRRIPRGETLSYGALATRAGSPRAARAVGNVMRSNRTPLVVPCHRVVASAGKLGGFSAPQGVSMKQRLLGLERPS